MQTPIVTIKGEDGNPLRVNETDFDPNTMTLFELVEVPNAPPQIVAAPLVPPVPLSDGQRLVAQIKNRFFVVDGTGSKLVLDGIDPKGYDTAETAWAAVQALPK